MILLFFIFYFFVEFPVRDLS